MFKANKTEQFREDDYFTDSSPLFGDDDPDIWISQVGRFDGVGYFRMNYIIEYHFCYIVYAGETELTLDGEKYVLKKGDLCFFLPGQHKILEESQQHPLQNIYIDLQGRNVMQVLTQLGIVKGHSQIFSGSFDELLDPLVKDIKTTFEQGNYISYYPIVAAWSLIELVGKSLHSKKKNATIDIAEAARLLLRQEFGSNVSVEEIATRLNVSRVTLFRHFKAKYGISPKQYLDNIRLNQAVLMLEKTTTPINEIGFHCGYDSPQHFTRMFKRKYALSPSQFRKGNGIDLKSSLDGATEGIANQ